MWWQLQNARPEPPPAQLYINGRILTMDAQNRIAQAMYIEGDRIVAVGDNAAVTATAPASLDPIDLSGRTLMPGIIDAHGHFPGEGLSAVAVDLNSPPIGVVDSIPQALDLLRAQAGKTPEGDWLYAFGYDDTLLAEGRHFTRQDLDAVSREHPILVQHISGHMGVVNSLGLEQLGIDKKTANPAGGEYVKDSSGEPTGLLLETALEPAFKQASQFGARQYLALLRVGGERYLARGVTTAQSGKTPLVALRGLYWASRFGLVPQRLEIWPDVAAADHFLDGDLDRADFENDFVDIGAVKITSDGSIQGYTGFLSRPYHVLPPERPADYRGFPTRELDNLRETMARFHRAGYQLAVHANGDAAIEAVTDIFERLQSESPREDARLVLVHAQMARRDQLARFKRLGITPTFFNNHVYYWGDRHRDRFLGPVRAARISPMAEARELGVRFSLHHDSPVVPMDPWLMAWNAVSRRTSSGKILGMDQGITTVQALRALTIDAAWQIFQEDNRGSLEPGKFADFVILARDPLASLNNLRDPGVCTVVIGGVRALENVANCAGGKS